MSKNRPANHKAKLVLIGYLPDGRHTNGSRLSRVYPSNPVHVISDWKESKHLAMLDAQDKAFNIIQDYYGVRAHRIIYSDAEFALKSWE